MVIKFDNTELDIILDTSSYRYQAIMGEHSLNLYFSSPEYVDIPVGAYCIYQNKKFSLTRPENFKKNSDREYSYTLILNDCRASLEKYKVRDIVSKRVKFDYTAKPKEHLQIIVDNLNMRESGWSLGVCIDADEKTIGYNHTYCLDGLKSIAEAFNTEWEIDNKTINLRKVEYNKDAPLPLSYGKGKGFKPGLGRTNLESSKPITVLLVQGGEKNIDPSKYGSKELLLPKSQSLVYEGRTYITDADGLYVTRGDKPLSTVEEDSLDCSNIYPKRVGSVSSVVVPDEKKNFYDFVDIEIPDNLNFENCLIAGEQMTVIFQSGMLAGKEFEVKYIHKEVSNNAEKAVRKFQITPQEIDGVMMPNDVYKPIIGDKYAVFGIQLPEAYVCDNTTKAGASWDMFKEAAKFLFENEDQKFTFTGELDGIWSKKRWLSIGGKIRLGGYVLFEDPHFQPEGIKIRITSVKDYIHNPYSPKIELSNTTVGGNISNDLNKIEENEVLTDKLFGDSIQFTKRRFRDAKETLEMLNNALLHFSGSINPISVQTMSLLVGDESLQYRFVNSKTSPTQVPHIITYDNVKKQLNVPKGIIQHMTLGIKSVSSTHKASEYKYWDMEAYPSPVLTDTAGYYLYAKVSTTGSTGTFLLSKSAVKMNGVNGYYHLLVGVLNSEFEEERSFVELYGFTEVLPGRITTDRVVSSDGLNFIDFVNNAFRIGNSQTFIDFNSQKDGKLRLKGTIVQSESGDESPIGCYRGAYNSLYTYYWGDEVTYTTSNGTSTYRYVNKTPSKGNAPTNASYWIIAAEGAKGNKGDDGIDGGYFEYRYAKNGSRTTPPAIITNVASPSGWSTSTPSIGTLEYLWFTVSKKAANGTLLQNWSTPKRMTPYDGIDGDKGDTGATMVYRGVYSGSKVYYGTAKRVDAVKHNGLYYVARVDAGDGFQNHAPGEAAYWNDFGAEFESIATNLLLAEGANIGDWFMSGGKIVSTLLDGNKITLDASVARIILESDRSGGDYSEDRYQGCTIKLDAINGLIEARNKNYRVAYMSPTGIFCNNAETQAVSACLGITRKASMVGLGYGNVNKSQWDNENFIAGVYGTASNSGTAPAYGGFFQNLMAAGLFLRMKAIEEREGAVYLSEMDSLVIGYSRNQQNVYLPNDGVIGRTIFFKQWWSGFMRVYPRGGQFLYDDTSANDCIDVGEGWSAMCVFTIGYIAGVKKEAWLMSKFRW